MAEQNALNKTRDELEKLSDQRLGEVLKAARKQAKRMEAAIEKADGGEAPLGEEEKAVFDYFDMVTDVCSTRPHFH